MRFDLPAGDHQVVLTLGQTAARRLGLTVTLSSLAVLAAVIAATTLWNRRRSALRS
jgi:ABC-type Fe3+-siderophore transport system permease subunit